MLTTFDIPAIFIEPFKNDTTRVVSVFAPIVGDIAAFIVSTSDFVDPIAEYN